MSLCDTVSQEIVLVKKISWRLSCCMTICSWRHGYNETAINSEINMNSLTGRNLLTRLQTSDFRFGSRLNAIAFLKKLSVKKVFYV